MTQNMMIYCSCGLWHELEELEGTMKFDNKDIPEAIICDECPICNEDLLRDEDEEAGGIE